MLLADSHVLRDLAGDLDDFLLHTNQQAQRYEALAEVHDTGYQIDMAYTGYHADWFLNPPYADGGGIVAGVNPTITVTEFYVTPFDRFVWNSPEESVVSELYPGKTIGFAIGIIDRDSKESARQESIHYLRAGELTQDCLGVCSLAMDYSDDFASGFLLGPGGELPDDSAVESITWGRIKAQFGK